MSKPGLAPVYESVREKLKTLLKSSIIMYPDCFVLPNNWTKYSSVLASSSDVQGEDFRVCLGRLSDRNRRLAREPGVEDAGTNRTPRQNIINILDKTIVRSNIDYLSDACLKTTDDQVLIVNTVLEWSTTQYRDRADRVYLGVRLLRQWNSSGIQLETPILNFLGNSETTTGLTKTNICRLITELARSQHFSVSKYLQWLIARGFQGSIDSAHHVSTFCQSSRTY